MNCASLIRRSCKHLNAESVNYVMEPKVDGVSISVHYRDGLLALGVTRGDGTTAMQVPVRILSSCFLLT